MCGKLRRNHKASIQFINTNCETKLFFELRFEMKTQRNIVCSFRLGKGKRKKTRILYKYTHSNLIYVLRTIYKWSMSRLFNWQIVLFVHSRLSSIQTWYYVKYLTVALPSASIVLKLFAESFVYYSIFFEANFILLLSFFYLS